ncbi:unnamed protein product [Lupinus luteus]|uniref:Uncharacterized protein n=1 Tax=Lupinus luteus TaxID=3873 RepID=A0AAV1W7U7_LUPLU
MLVAAWVVKCKIFVLELVRRKDREILGSLLHYILAIKVLGQCGAFTCTINEAKVQNSQSYQPTALSDATLSSQACPLSSLLEQFGMASLIMSLVEMMKFGVVSRYYQGEQKTIQLILDRNGEQNFADDWRFNGKESALLLSNEDSRLVPSNGKSNILCLM